MRVDVFSPVFYPEVSGMSNHVLLLAKGLLNHNCEIMVYTLNTRNLPKKEAIERIKIKRLDSKNDFFVYEVSKKLSSYLVKDEPDIVHFHGLLSGLTALLTKKPKKTRFVVTLHTLWDENREYYVPNLISDIQEVQKVILSSDKIDRYIAVSTHLKEIAIDNGCTPSRISVVHNGIDLSMFDRRDSFKKENLSQNKESDFINILILSRISPEKGIVEFVREFPKAVEKCPTLRLAIVGNNEPKDYIRVSYFNELLRHINSNFTLQKHINIVGDVPYKKVPEVLFSSDILVMPSFHEGLSMAMIEGMASGTPVVAFNVGGCNEIIQSGINGILVDPMNYREMMEKIILLASDSTFRCKIGQNAHKTAKLKFSSHKMVQEVISIYEKCL